MKTILYLAAAALLLAPAATATPVLNDIEADIAQNECDGTVDVFCINKTRCVQYYMGQCIFWEWEACYVWVNGFCVSFD